MRTRGGKERKIRKIRSENEDYSLYKSGDQSRGERSGRSHKELKAVPERNPKRKKAGKSSTEGAGEQKRLKGRKELSELFVVCP
jgi:hypothetical protein